MSAVSPGGSIRPILGSVYSPSTYRRTPESISGEGNVSSLKGLECSSAPTRATAPNETFLDPSVSESGQRYIQRPLDSSIERSNDGGNRSEPPQNSPSQTKYEIVPLQQHDQDLPELPMPAAAPKSGKVRQTEGTQQASRSVDAGVARPPRNDVEEVESAGKTPYQTLLKAGDLRGDGPLVSRKISDPLTPDIRKKDRGFSSGSGSPGREPDEIQIHIGRIEVTAVAQPMPRPALLPIRKPISLDDYLRRGDGRSR